MAGLSTHHQPMQRLPNGRVGFRPQLFWQEILPEHVVGSDLEIRMGVGALSDGKSYARLKRAVADSSEADISETGRYAKAQQCISENSPYNDRGPLREIFCAAATWGDVERIKLLLSSCYVTQDAGSAALLEAAANGHGNCVEVLLQAGATLANTTHGKTALHAACQGGHEKAAMAIAAHAAGSEIKEVHQIVWALDPLGRTAWQIASDCESGGLAKRLHAYVLQNFAKG